MLEAHSAGLVVVPFPVLAGHLGGPRGDQAGVRLHMRVQGQQALGGGGGERNQLEFSM